MKYKYCPECKKAYLKSKLERDKCIYCGKRTEIVDVRRSKRYYQGYAIMLLGAALIVIIRLWFSDFTLLWLAGIFFIIFGGWLVMDASGQMAKEAAEMVKKDRDEDQ